VNILILNAGSSSLKWKLFEMRHTREIASGLIEGIAEAESCVHLTHLGQTTSVQTLISNHDEAFTELFETLNRAKLITDIRELSAIGHRVVHGGEYFTEPTHITHTLLEQLKTLHTLAPLHNPANVLGIEICMKLAEDVPNIAVFDTAFHSTLPPSAYRYALPKHLYTEAKIRRYGFHGTSHHFVAKKAADTLQKPLETLNLITLHLGNGASACAIKNGKSVDTSMGFTPLEGLVMGTRCGDIDPAVVSYLIQEKKQSTAEVSTLLNKESGLKGLCGDNDLRNIIKRAADDDEDAITALEVFSYRIRKYIGAYIAVLGRVDAIVFTGGIGEHASLIRQKVLEDLEENFGIVLDQSKNRHLTDPAIHQEQSRIALLVIPTNEELQIALETVQVAEKL